MTKAAEPAYRLDAPPRRECRHTGKRIRKLRCVICAECRVILYYGAPLPEDEGRLTN